MTDMWGQEYWAQKDNVKLYMYRKRMGAPVAGEAPKPILFLVHGSSFSGPSGFDLHVTGKTDYSLMEKFAEYGYDVWTLDHEGYGRSDSTDGNSPIAEGVRDLMLRLSCCGSTSGGSCSRRKSELDRREPDHPRPMARHYETHCGTY